MSRLARISSGARRLWAHDVDLKDKHAAHHGASAGCLGMLALAWASIGVIYGDIGTSPLYVYSTIFETQPSHEDVLCATSLIFWSITLVVLLKYVFIVLLADDNGEGGTFALYAQICRACGINQTNQADMAADKQLYEQAGSSAAATPSSSTRQLKVGPAQQQHPQGAPGAAAAQEQQDGHADSHTGPQKAPLQQQQQHASHPPKHLSWLGTYLRNQLAHDKTAQKALLGMTLLMTAMVLGDGVLTPSISVLSAVSGLQIKAGLTNSAVIGITCAILVGLFGIQCWGTQRVGVLFAPIIALFFLSNVIVGIYNICSYEGGAIFRAMSPHYIGIWFQRHGSDGWLRLAGVFLCLTGCEAMFADLGHFSRQSIQLSFMLAVYPSLILTYFGQASWLMHHLDGFTTVFYSSLPTPVFWPIFVVSVLASIVASQALITGAFSMVYQSMAMGCFPRFKVHHTSEEVGGQIFIPEVNYTLLVLCVAVVAGFQSGTAIGNAYGIAVNVVMLSTVFLVGLVMLVAWGTHPLLVLLFLAPFALIEGVFLSANILNIPDGGWFSITLAVVLSAVNALWIWGSAEKAEALKREQFQLSDLLTTKPPSNFRQAGMGMSSQGWRLFRVGSGAPIHRNPGMALVYCESPFNVPAVFKRLVDSWGVHSIVVFLTVRQVPMPHVSQHDRLLLAPLEYRGFHKCVARYGYMDKVDQGELFAQSVLDKVAALMPGHAMLDSMLAHHTLHSTSPSPTAGPEGCCGGGGATAAAGTRGAPCLQPSIAEEPPGAQSADGGAADGGAADGGVAAKGALGGVSGSSGSDGLKAAGSVSGAREVAAVHCSDMELSAATRPLAGTSAAAAAAVVSLSAAAHALRSTDGLVSHETHSGPVGVELSIPTAAEPVVGLGPMPHRRTTWESRRTLDGPAAVSELAAHAVYVLHRTIIHVKPRGSIITTHTREFLIGVVYQQLWHLTTRFWEGWKVPASRMFEVGMVIEL